MCHATSPPTPALALTGHSLPLSRSARTALAVSLSSDMTNPMRNLLFYEEEGLVQRSGVPSKNPVFNSVGEYGGMKEGPRGGEDPREGRI